MINAPSRQAVRTGVFQPLDTQSVAPLSNAALISKLNLPHRSLRATS